MEYLIFLVLHIAFTLAGRGEPYEENMVVPFILRGLGIPSGLALQGYLAGNTDVATMIANWQV